MEKKSILEQALLQISTIEEATIKNSKAILRSVMKEEINDLMKQEDESSDDEDDLNTSEETDGDVGGEKTPVDGDEDSDKKDSELDNEDGELDDEEDDELGDELDNELGDELGDEDDDEDVIDATDFSEDEVIKVFKAMKPEDGIIVKKEGNKLEVSDEDNEYIIKLDEQEGALQGLKIGNKPKKDVAESDLSEEDDGGDDETIYEIELGDEDAPEETTEAVTSDTKKYHEKETKPFASKNTKNIEATEAARTIGNGVRPPAQKTKFKAGRYDMMNEQITLLKKQNGEYKKALTMFKEKLNEIAVFNSALSYATRLFTEGTTTKSEKLEILKRFDTVSTLTESKNLYEQIKTELGTKKTITETVENKINITPKKSTSSEVLIESKQYENPQFKRMKELINKMK